MQKHLGFVFRDSSEKSQSIVSRDLRAMSQSYTRSYGFVASHGKGSEVWDVDGYRYVDFAAGIAVLATGFGHDRVVKAIQDQSEQLIHMGGTDYFYEAQVELAELLQEIIPIHRAEQPQDKRIFFANSGTESIEAAMKLARYRGGKNSRRKIILAFYGAFHGRTYGALSLTSSKPVQRVDYPYLPGGVVHVPYPSKFAYENSHDKSSIEFDTRRYIETYVFKQTSPDEIAAIFVEAIQGEGGYMVPVDHFLPDLRAFCDQHGILLVADEVQSGMGRTGKWTAFEHWNVRPDIVCLAKGLGSGLPIGAIVAHKDVMDIWQPGAHANTFGGNLLSCKSAIATIETIKSESLMKNAEGIGAFITEELNKLKKEFPHIIRRVDGKGLMIGVEFATRDGKSLATLRNAVEEQCFLHGLLTLGCGTSTLRIAPALVITHELASEGMGLLRSAILSALEELDQDSPPIFTSYGVRILVVEDEPAIVRIIEGALERTFGRDDFYLEIAADYENAVRKLSGEDHFDLVTLDNSLTDSHTDNLGLNLLPILAKRHQQSGTAVIAISGTLTMRDFRDLVVHGFLLDVIDKAEDAWNETLQHTLEKAFQSRIAIG